jgi:hypothetical protein
VFFFSFVPIAIALLFVFFRVQGLMQLKVVIEKLLYPIELLLIKVDCCGFPSISIVVTSTITMTNFTTINVKQQWV